MHDYSPLNPLGYRSRAMLIVSLCIYGIFTFVGNAVAYDLSRGRQVMLNRGLQLQTWLGDPPTDPSLCRSAGFTTVSSVWHTRNQMLAAPGWPADQPWSRCWDTTKPERRMLDAADLPYVASLVSIQYDDEVNVMGDLATVEATFRDWNQHYPNALAHANFWGSQLNAEQLSTYTQATKPDLLLYDQYPLHSSGHPGRDNMYTTMQKFRTVALAGYTTASGGNSGPLPYGQFLDLYRPSYNHPLPSESFVRLQQSASWAFGYTLTSCFIYDQPAVVPSVCPVLFNSYGDTDLNSEVFNYVKESNRQSRNLGPALIRMVSTDIQMITGTEYAALPDDISQWNWGSSLPWNNRHTAETGTYADYITSIRPTVSEAGATDMDYADILIGYFNPLLNDNPDYTFVDGLRFMIVNGDWGTSYLPGESGDSASLLAQWYRISFDFTSTDFDSLVRLSRETGNVELVPLTSTGGSSYFLDLNLPGGTGDLFGFWNSDNPLPTIPEPSGICLLSTALLGMVGYVWKKHKMRQ